MFPESEPSCSDCKLEMVQKRWNELLVNWVNKCVDPPKHIEEPTERGLVEIINKYKHDICSTDFDRAMLCTDDLEPFLIYKYPILRLRYFTEDKCKKLYIMTSMLLYHCVVSSVGGKVVNDICRLLDPDEQEMVLRFCECLSLMETTINNVEHAIGVTVPKSPYDSTDCSKSSLQPDSYTDTERTWSNSAFENNSKELTAIYTARNARPRLKDIREPSEFDKGEPKKNRSIGFILPDQLEKPANNEGYAGTEACGAPGTKVNGGSDGDGVGDRGKKHAGDGAADKFKSLIEMIWSWKHYIIILILTVIALSIGITFSFYFKNDPNEPLKNIKAFAAKRRSDANESEGNESEVDSNWSWQCVQNRCQRVRQKVLSHNNNFYNSQSRCYLLCMGPQLWPLPIGNTQFSKELVALATNRLEYKFQSVPSDIVHLYLAEAFKLFLGDLARLERIGVRRNEKNNKTDLPLKKLYIQIDVESDPEPKLRLNTDESYYLTVNTKENQVKVVITSASFCGVRHGLETLSQLILYDQATGGLVTLSNSIVKDAPSYKYRGLMIDTGRNFIPVSDIMRTIDAMSTCKMNTFHWRITDATSFPLSLPTLANLFEYGAYDRSMKYTKEDIKSIVRRAEIRGIRVLIEVAIPGPVGRAWSWSDDATCPLKKDNATCENVLCLRLKMKEEVFLILQHIYSEIINLTEVEDVFHMSDGVYSFSNCYFLLENREGFLEKALYRLKLANKGFLPTLPIIWYTGHLAREFEAKSWERLGVQLTNGNPTMFGQSLRSFRVIHSGRWSLSCETKKLRCVKYRTWQDMYAWKGWNNIDAFSTEGGEAVLWTDLVDGGNLDYTLWPRTAAVAERLWSDLVIKKTVSDGVYLRLDGHRLRMLLRGIKVPPIWPAWCSINPSVCLEKITKK